MTRRFNFTKVRDFMKKRILSVILVLTILCSSFVFSTMNALAETSGDFEYEVLEDGTANIISYAGEATELVIPSEIDGHKVTSIGEWSFEGSDTLKSVKIPNSVIEIGEFAFVNCVELEKVEIPSSIIYIGYEAVNSCDIYYGGTNSQWEKIETQLPEKVSIHCKDELYTDSGFGYLVENDNVAITSYKGDNKEIVIPSQIDGYDVTNIGNFAFDSCDTLTSVTIPNSVKTIGAYAFSWCDALKSVIIPNSVTNIESFAFWCCEALSSLEIPNSVINIGEFAFQDCKNVTTLTLGNSVANIGDYAFANCSALTSIEIPGSVISIGDYAFNYCFDLIDFEVSKQNENYSSVDGVLFNKDKTILIQYPISKKDAQYIIPNGVINIANSAFEWCEYLSNIEFSDSVIEIGDSAFASCRLLTKVKIGNNVKFIKALAFYDCSSVEKVEIGSNVISIGDGAFYYCNLTDIYYNGTEEAWNKISIGADNENITPDIIRFNSFMPESSTFELKEGSDLIISFDTQVNNSIILGASVGILQKELLANFVNSEKIQMLDKDNNLLEENDVIGTGTLLQLTENENVIDNLIAVIRGEIDGDGVITTKDVTLQRRFIANWESDIIETAADVDGDGVVNAKDTALIRRYIAGWDVAL